MYFFLIINQDNPQMLKNLIHTLRILLNSFQTGGVQPGDIRRGAGVSGKLPFSKVPTHPLPVTLVE